MWNQIVNDLRKLKGIQARAADIAKQQIDVEARLAKGDYLQASSCSSHCSLVPCSHGFFSRFPLSISIPLS